ncbi:MAG: hypothetical protein SPG45_05465 [Lactobacillus johnsonii]|nr:hypothetical protein [Lactobacillus johnsonii]MDY5419482.1 hypothetical protein [Lactobacillus johnsonii]
MSTAEIFEELYKMEFEWGTLNAETIHGWVGLTIDAAAYKRITGQDYTVVTAPKEDPVEVELPKQTDSSTSTYVR